MAFVLILRVPQPPSPSERGMATTHCKALSPCLVPYTPESLRKVIRTARGLAFSPCLLPGTPESLSVGDGEGPWQTSLPMPSA